MQIIIPFRNLDRDVFQIPQDGQNPIMHPQGRVQIMSDVLKLNSIANVRYAIVFGDILISPESTTNCNVLVGLREKDVNKINSMSLNLVIQNMNKNFLLGTRHRMNYILTTEKYDSKNFEQIYAPFDEKWLKYMVTDSNDSNVKKKNKFLAEKRHLEDELKGREHDLTWGKVPFASAKKANAGIWPVTLTQAVDLVSHFRTKMPNRKTRYKMLGNTGIMLYRPGKNRFYLAKGDAIRKKIERIVLKHKMRKIYAP